MFRGEEEGEKVHTRLAQDGRLLLLCLLVLWKNLQQTHCKPERDFIQYRRPRDICSLPAPPNNSCTVEKEQGESKYKATSHTSDPPTFCPLPTSRALQTQTTPTLLPSPREGYITDSGPSTLLPPSLLPLHPPSSLSPPPPPSFLPLSSPSTLFPPSPFKGGIAHLEEGFVQSRPGSGDHTVLRSPD